MGASLFLSILEQDKNANLQQKGTDHARLVAKLVTGIKQHVHGVITTNYLRITNDFSEKDIRMNDENKMLSVNFPTDRHQWGNLDASVLF